MRPLWTSLFHFALQVGPIERLVQNEGTKIALVILVQGTKIAEFVLVPYIIQFI